MNNVKLGVRASACNSFKPHKNIISIASSMT